MNKTSKALSILLSVLIILSAANLFVGLSNTYRIKQLENAPAVVIEEYLNETENSSYTETTVENIQADTSAETSTEITTKTTVENTTENTVPSTDTAVSETASPDINKTEEEKTTAETTVKETEATNSGICFVTNSGTKYHKEGCSYLKKSKTKMTVQEAKSNGYSPCSRCY